MNKLRITMTSMALVAAVLAGCSGSDSASGDTAGGSAEGLADPSSTEGMSIEVEDSLVVMDDGQMQVSAAQS